jgi:hypothetical protein
MKTNQSTKALEVVGRRAFMKRTCPEYVHSERTHEKTDVISLPP